MNELALIQTEVNEFTESLIQFCKPLMLDMQMRKESALLLGSESNLRMTVELAFESKEKKDIVEKLILSLEEAALIACTIKNLKIQDEVLKNSLQTKSEQIKIMLEELIGRLKPDLDK